ncbi:MAG: flagellar hook capping protein [Ignavibacterium sp.]|nr:flagellar hook capping protein [Ignavibacterium sp.]MCX7610625.1 flagellar hook capping protein [Ignavibacterium sp.]MDW8374127.1 flagellar hook capping FlgD N-terminal domain-containing protein [Ignavibacteriales bacterium]
MVTGNISSVNNTTTNTRNSKNVMGKDDFLKLMLAQMRNQDPLNPMESAEFAAQLAQFTSVEQLMNLNDSMKTSLDANYLLSQSINNTLAATLIGNDAKLDTSEFRYSGQDEQILGYNLSTNAKDVTIKIYNENGALVRTIQNASGNAGDNKLSWDFTDNNGEKVSFGKYRFEVTATDYNGNAINVETFLFGKIDGVRFTEFGTKLIINGIEFNLSDIKEILKP